MTTVQEAKAVQEQVEAKVRELNVLMHSARTQGIRFEVEVVDRQDIDWSHPVPVIDVLTLVSPNDLEAS